MRNGSVAGASAFLLEEAVIEGSPKRWIAYETIGNNLGNPGEAVTRMLRCFQTEDIVNLARTVCS